LQSNAMMVASTSVPQAGRSNPIRIRIKMARARHRIPQPCCHLATHRIAFGGAAYGTLGSKEASQKALAQESVDLSFFLSRPRPNQLLLLALGVSSSLERVPYPLHRIKSLLTPQKVVSLNDEIPTATGQSNTNTRRAPSQQSAITTQQNQNPRGTAVGHDIDALTVPASAAPRRRGHQAASGEGRLRAITASSVFTCTHEPSHDTRVAYMEMEWTHGSPDTIIAGGNDSGASITRGKARRGEAALLSPHATIFKIHHISLHRTSSCHTYTIMASSTTLTHTHSFYLGVLATYQPTCQGVNIFPGRAGLLAFQGFELWQPQMIAT
jgi:hypothetical protein